MASEFIVLRFPKAVGLQHLVGGAGCDRAEAFVGYVCGGFEMAFVEFKNAFRRVI